MPPPYDHGSTPGSAAPEGASEPFDFAMPDLGDVAGIPPESESAAAEEALPFSPELPEPEAEDLAPTEAAVAEDFSVPDFDLIEEKPAEAAPAEAGGAAFDSDFSIPEPESKPGEDAEKPAEAELGADSFETFTFEEPGVSQEPSLAEFETGSDLDTEIASLSEEAPIADTFKIDQDWGGFGSFGG